LNIPGMSHRTVVLGETGTGKSVGAIFLLSQQDFLKYPWTIIDYKGDELLDEIFAIKSPYIKTLKVGDKPPKKPGLYRLCPEVETEDDAVIAYLWQVYKQQNHGLYLDEGYAIPNEKNCAPLNAIFTQGRARKTPIICCYQRPVYMSRFAIAQASFICHFEEDDVRDLKTVSMFLPPAKVNGKTISVYTQLPKYWSLWRDKGARKTEVLQPFPPPKQVVEIFRQRLGIVQPSRRLGAHV
jgi:hypothetical protein